MKKIVSYNVNGIRAALNKGLYEWLEKESPDIVCFQELKANHDQINEGLFRMLGYECYWNPAERKGYSGVAILTKEKPENVVVGLGNERYDCEGRVLRADFKNFSLICVYVPSGTMGDIRQDFKMDFLEVFFKHLNDVRKEKPNLIVSGDFNICHKPIDINHPERHNNMSGFLPEERQWVDKLIDNGFIDSFRMFNSNANQYSWWSYRAGARQKNLGWRIDYNIVSEQMRNTIKNADIHPNNFQSDHCPVSIEVEC